MPGETEAVTRVVRLPPDAYRPPVGCSEAVFQRAVIALAKSLGWRVAHFRRVRVSRGKTTYWETPVAADGKGHPDLELVRDRLLMVELKTDSKSDSRLKAEQVEWRDAYRRAGVEWYCWRPHQWADIVATLAPLPAAGG